MSDQHKASPAVPDLGAAVARLEQAVAELDRLRAEVAVLVQAGGRQPKPTRPPKRLFSLRAAARALGISPTETLPGLIRQKRVKVVTVNGRPKISVDEIERVCREGTDLATSAPVRRTAQAAIRQRAPLARDLV